MVWSAIPLERTSFHKWAPVYNYTASPLTLINNTYLVCSWDCWESFITGYPTPGPVLVYGLLGTRPHSRRWKDGEQGKIHLYLYPLPTACITTWVSPPTFSVEKLFSMKSVPGVKKVGGSCFTTHCEHSLQSTVGSSKGISSGRRDISAENYKWGPGLVSTKHAGFPSAPQHSWKNAALQRNPAPLQRWPL